MLVDHRQNGHGKTIASAYSVRPKPGAPVSTPLRWEELTDDVRPTDFGMKEALARIEQHGDLYEPVLRGGQSLGPGAESAARKGRIGRGYGWSFEVSTTSKLEPVTRPSVCSWSFDHPGLGAPLMNQSPPLSATSIP